MLSVLALIGPFIMMLPSSLWCNRACCRVMPAPESAPPAGVEQKGEMVSVMMIETLELLCVVSEMDCKSEVLSC